MDKRPVVPNSIKPMPLEPLSSCIGFPFFGDCDMPEGQVLERLGDILYWIGCIIAAIVVVWGAIFCFRDSNSDDPYLFSVVAVGAFSIWVIGRALRYILSGK